jgi:hypothetical protein
MALPDKIAAGDWIEVARWGPGPALQTRFNGFRFGGVVRIGE